jgi:hypothetical protein
VAAGFLGWLGGIIYGFMVVVMLFGSVMGTLQWVVDHSRKHRPRVPEWLGPLYFWLWVAWAGILAVLLVPQVLSLSSLLDLYRGRDFAWLLPALFWSVGAIVLPAGILFAGRWSLARAQRKRKEEAKAHPWNKFEAIGYRLDWKQVFSIPAVVIYDENREEPVVTTVGKVLNEILPGRFNVPGEPEGTKAPVPNSKEFMGSVEVKAPDGRTIEVETIRGGDVDSKRFAAELVEGILKLFRITENVSDCVLFFYECDHGYHDTTWWENYNFFVVHEDKIVLETFKLSSLCDDFFDPAVLKSMYEKEEWQKGLDDDEEGAEEDPEDDGELTPGQKTAQRWWYRRFYTETRTGQMRVFWNDILYNYMPPEHREAGRDARLRRVEFGVLGIAGLLVAHYVFKWF